MKKAREQLFLVVGVLFCAGSWVDAEVVTKYAETVTINAEVVTIYTEIVTENAEVHNFRLSKTNIISSLKQKSAI
ncbi:hypothetical protein [Oceanobacillus sp. CAU 1775]